MIEWTDVAHGLQFPEGPVPLADGSVLVVEIRRGTVTRVRPDGTAEVVARTGGGPNGAAFGPDGRLYVCNSGGFEWIDADGLTLPGDQPADYAGGSIQRVDIDTGTVETLYTSCNGHPLKGPNDIVFDASGGFWFTDLGKTRARDMDRGGLYYARPDGSEIREVVFPLFTPNGVGLSPDGKRVYVAETYTARVFYWEILGPGEVARRPTLNGGELLAGLPGWQLLDSLAVDCEGHVCVATILNGGITRISPDGSQVCHYATSDPLTTNICFGGEDGRTAWVTLSGTGRLARGTWPVAGAPLSFGR